MEVNEVIMFPSLLPASADQFPGESFLLLLDEYRSIGTIALIYSLYTCFVVSRLDWD